MLFWLAGVGISAYIFFKGFKKYVEGLAEKTVAQPLPPSTIIPPEDSIPTPEMEIYRPSSREQFVTHFRSKLAKVDILSLVGKSRGVTENSIIAIAGLESGWGGVTAKGIYLKTNNLFSIRDTGWKGPSVGGFRAYPSWEASIKDWVRLMNRPHYTKTKKALLQGDGKLFFQEIKKAGYDTTNPKYAELGAKHLEYVAGLT